LSRVTFKKSSALFTGANISASTKIDNAFFQLQPEEAFPPALEILDSCLCPVHSSGVADWPKEFVLFQ
jgi:hypothetical protein